MLIIRFQPMGRTHRKFFRIVLADKKRAVSKKFIKVLGWYDPYTKSQKLDEEVIKHYIAHNVEISPSVQSLFKKAKLM